jgi:hypothetical protein
MTADLEDKSFEQIVAECNLLLDSLEADLERWQEVLDNARSNKSVPGL